MPATSNYAALLALLFVLLSVRTIGARRRLKIPIGDAGDESMLRAMRVHSNFAEYVPLGLLLIYFVEISGARAWLVHSLGICLVAGRLSHAFGVSQARETYGFRVTGMALTLTTILVPAGYLIYCLVK